VLIARFFHEEQKITDHTALWPRRVPFWERYGGH